MHTEAPVISHQSADAAKAYGTPRKTALIFLAIFGLTLFGVNPVALPVPINIADMTLAILVAYSLLHYGRMTINGISKATVLLALVIAASGAVNMLREPAFDTSNFLTNYIRVMGVTAGVLFLPSLLRRIGHDTLAKTSAMALVVHALVVIADAASLIPAQWLPHTELGVRASGLFREPSFFGLFVGMALLYIAQVQRNEHRIYLGAIPLGIILTAMFISTAVGGILLTGLGVIALYGGISHRSRAGMLMVLAGIIIGLLLVIPITPDTPIAKSWNYLADRAGQLNPVSLTDESARGRLLGSWELAFAATKEAPLLGTGIGGASQIFTFEKYKDTFTNLFEAGTWTMLASILQGTGILGLIPFSYIMFRMIVDSRTRWFGIGFAFASLLFGGVFDVYVWWNIMLASSLLVSGKAPQMLDTEGAEPQEKPLARPLPPRPLPNLTVE
jgi:hypothetical protein